MDNNDKVLLEQIQRRKVEKEDYEDLYKRLFGIEVSSTEARKRLRGLEVYLENKSKGFALDEDPEDVEKLFKELSKVNKQKQRYMDQIRIMRKERRFENRIENVVSGFLEEVESRIERFIPSKTVPKIIPKTDKVEVIQLSDIHFGEVVDLDTNKYNFEVAEDRLDRLFSESINRCKTQGINKICVLTTGDLFNLDTHLDKMLTNEAPRAESLQRGFNIICKMLDRLLSEGLEVSIAGILGNESRLFGLEKMSTINSLALDNFDYLLFVLLKTRYDKNIKFLNNCDKLEDMVNINGKNIILVHGNNLKHNRLEDEVLKLKLKWFKNTGIMADYICLGHIHSTLITHIFARSASLVGGNGYSEMGLNIPESSASQNLMRVGEEIEVTAIRLN